MRISVSVACDILLSVGEDNKETEVTKSEFSLTSQLKPYLKAATKKASQPVAQ